MDGLVAAKWRSEWMLAGCASLAAVIVGVVAVEARPTYVLALIVLVAAIGVGIWNRGALAGLLVLLLTNGLPFFNAQPDAHVAGSGVVIDLGFLALVVLLGGCALRSVPNAEQRRLVRWASAYGTIYLGWWLLKVVSGSPGIPLIAAAAYGREFMYFAILLPLLILALCSRERLTGFVAVLVVGVALYAIAQFATQVGHLQLPWLVHTTESSSFEGVTRLYTAMRELVIAVFPLAFAAALLGPARWRKPATALAILMGIAIVLSFQRAVYFSDGVALLIISLIWAIGKAWGARRIQLALFVAACLATIAVMFAGQLAPSTESSSPVGAVIARISLGLTNLQNQGGTFGLRLREDQIELAAVRGKWLAGIGFLSPQYHYVNGLHEGNIKDIDLGSITILVTMGVIGLILAYTPIIASLIYMLKRRKVFISYGAAIYLTAGLIGSITLSTYADQAGLVVLASVLAVCLNVAALTPSARSVDGVPVK